MSCGRTVTPSFQLSRVPSAHDRGQSPGVGEGDTAGKRASARRPARGPRGARGRAARAPGRGKSGIKGARREAGPPELRARRLREALEELGPTFAKIGQILSTRPD